jgi:hypothetical protein
MRLFLFHKNEIIGRGYFHEIKNIPYIIDESRNCRRLTKNLGSADRVSYSSQESNQEKELFGKQPPFF